MNEVEWPAGIRRRRRILAGAEAGRRRDARAAHGTHHFPPGSEKDFTGADLHEDDGDDFYGMTLHELKANAKADPTDQEGYRAAKAEREAAVAANTLSGDHARAKLIAATLAPDNGAPRLTEAQKAEAAKQEAKAIAEKPAAAIERVSASDVPG